MRPAAPRAHRSPLWPGPGRGGLVLALLLALSPAHSRARQPGWAATLRGVDLLVQGQLTAAVGEFARAKQQAPSPLLDAMVGLVALEGDDAALASRQLERAISRGAHEPLLRYWAARAALAAGHGTRARRHLRRLLAKHDDPRAQLALAVLLGPTSASQAARALVRAAARHWNLLDPWYYPTPTEGAVELLGSALSGLPQRRILLRTQGHLLWRADRPLPACGLFRTLLRQQATSVDVLQMNARCAALWGQERRALQLVNAALRRSPGHPQVLAARGELLLDQGQVRPAIRDLRRAVDALPHDARLLARLAQAHAAAGQPKQAQRFFRLALRQDPASRMAAVGLATLLSRHKPSAASERAVRRALSLCPDDPATWDAAAAQARLGGNLAEAARLAAGARRARRQQRGLSRRRQQVARVLRQLGQLQRALDAPKSCQHECPRRAAALPAAARLFYEAGRAEERGQRALALRLALRLVPRLRRTSLLIKDPTELRLRTPSKHGPGPWLRIHFPCVPPWKLSAGTSK